MTFKVWMMCSLVIGVIGSVQGAAPIQPGVAVSSDIVDFNELDTPVQMLEQFDPSLLENLAAPTTAPAQIRLPPAVMEAGQWRGSQCGILKSAHTVFRKTSDWDKFWTLAIKPYLSHPLETPPVDFSKDMIVAVFLGEKPNPGAMIEIRSIKPVPHGDDPILEITYKDTSQMQGVFIPPFPVQPFHLKKVPAFAGRVVFREAGRPVSQSH